MRQGPSGWAMAASGIDTMAADVSCGAGAGPVLIQSFTMALDIRKQLLVIAEINGRFAAAGVGEVDFQVTVDGVAISALVNPDDVPGGINRTVTYAQQDVAADEVVLTSFSRVLLLGAGQRVIGVTGSATTQAFEVNGATDAEHGCSILVQDLGRAFDG